MAIEVIARTTGSGDGGTVSLSQPTHIAGDLLVVLVNVADLSTAPTAVTSGWILIDRDTFTGGQIMAFAKVATSTSDPLSFGPGAEKWAYRAYSIRGHGISNVLDLAPGFLTGSNTSCNYATKANLTTTLTYLSLVASAGEAGDVVAASAPIGWSQFAKVSTGNTSSNAAITTAERIVTGVTSLVPGSTTMEDNGVFGTYHILVPEATTVAIPQGGVTGAFVFGAAIVEGRRASSGATTGAFTFGAAIAGGSAPRRGGVTGAFTFGAAVASGDTPPNRGGATGAFTFGAAVAAGAAAAAGAASAAFTFGPAVVSGSAAEPVPEGGFESGGISWSASGGVPMYSAFRFQPTRVRQSAAGGDPDLNTMQISEFQVVVDGVRQAGATAYSINSNHFGDETPANANDGNLGTKYANNPTTTGAYIYLVFPAPVAAEAVRIGIANDLDVRDPVEFDIYGSNDTTGAEPGTWTLLRSYDWSDLPSPPRQSYLPDFPLPADGGFGGSAPPTGGFESGGISWSASGGGGTYSAYRFQTTETRGTGPSGIVQMSEFQVLIDGVRQAPFSVYGVGMDMPPSEGMANVGDGDTGTKWLNFNVSNGYFYLYYLAPIAANGYRIATANDSPERDPVRFDVYGSNDSSPFGVGTWTLLASDVLDPGAEPPIGRFQYSADYALPAVGGFDGRAAAEGDVSGAVTFGAATTGGARASSGGVTGGFTFGAAVAEGRSVRRGAAAGAFVFGPAVANGTRTSRGNVVGSFLFGPTAATGAAVGRGNVAGSFLFGPAVVDGTVPIIPVPTGGATGSFQFGAAVADGRRVSRGAVSSAFTFGPTTAAGAAASRGGVTGGFVFGPTAADGRRVSRGGVAGAFVFGPTTSGGRVTPRGNVAAAFQFGPAVADGGEFPGVGGISGSFQFGPAVVEGEMPSKGGVTGGFAFGPAEVGGVSVSGGSVVGAITFGPATASGTRRSAGLASGSLTYGPATVEGRTQRRGGFAGTISWGVPQWDGGRDSDGGATGSISWGPGAAEGLSSSGGGVTGAITFGPAVTGGNAAARGEFTGSITYGPGGAGATARALGEAEGAYGWGVPQWDGYAPARGGVDGAFEFGPAEIDASAALAGGAYGAILWGPARAEGGDFEQPLCWPGTITLVPRWPGWSLAANSVVVSVVADGPSVLLLEDGPAVTLAASGLSVALTSDGPGIVLASDGPNVVLIPEDAC